MESSTISATLRIHTGVYYVTIPKKTVESLELKTGDPIAVKISGSLVPEGF